MFNQKDIQKLIEAQEKVFVTKEDIKNLSVEVVSSREEIRELKEDVAGLRESVQVLVVSVDKLVKATENLHQEYLAISVKVDRHEKWFHQVAEKLGIKLEY